MKHYALIGEKLGHSVSQPIHEAIFRIIGADADYRIIEIPRDHFEQETRGLIASLDGFNITIPYKQDVMPLLTEIDPYAASIGAVNTVLTGDVNRGFNTDAPGFMRMLEHYGIDPAKTAHSFILGSGGTSKTVLACLKEMGSANVHVVSRHPDPDKPHEISYDQFYEAFPQCGGVLVNASSAGMWPRRDADNICAIRPDRVDEMMQYASAVADVVYNPPETFLTQSAARAGKPWCTGLYMLIEQAVQAEAIWQGHAMPEGLTERLMKELKLI
ncbi:MAG: shikimate dehydrogenase [Clostridia bacterium]|nr:shikimate dehydrogenase [Clostridia bacterium]